MHKCKQDYFEMIWLRDIFCVSLWNWDCPGQTGTSGHAAYNAGWCGEVLVACFRLFWSSSDVCNFPLEHFPPLVISVDFSIVLVFCRSKCHSRCGLMWVWGLRGSFIHSVCLCSSNRVKAPSRPWHPRSPKGTLSWLKLFLRYRTSSSMRDSSVSNSVIIL